MAHLLYRFGSRNAVEIRLFDLRNETFAADLATELKSAEWVTEITFEFEIRSGPSGPLPVVNWDPLLQEIETRENLESVRMRGSPARIHLPLCRRIFQALQGNPNIRSLLFEDVDFSDNNIADLVVSYLDSASNLMELAFVDECSDSSETKYVATAIQRNKNIQTLLLKQCQDDFIAPIFQKLASLESLSCLKKLAFECRDFSLTVPAMEAMQQYLDSSKSTIQCFQLACCHVIVAESSSGFATLFEAMVRNNKVNEIAFAHCRFHAIPGGENRQVQQLVNLVTRKLNLSTLHLKNTDFFAFRQFTDSLAEVLVRPGSPLNCLHIDNPSFSRDIPIAVFRPLLTAMSRSTRLVRFSVGNIDWHEVGYVQALIEAIPLFKVEELTLTFDGRPREGQEESLLEALQRNYKIQRVRCKTSGGGRSCFTETSQSRLDFYLYRNKKLAQWVSNPKLVPCDLYSYAIRLAMKAGINSLYQSLLALSGQGIGLQQKKRKRK